MSTIDPVPAVCGIEVFLRSEEGFRPANFDELLTAARAAIADLDFVLGRCGGFDLIDLENAGVAIAVDADDTGHLKYLIEWVSEISAERRPGDEPVSSQGSWVIDLNLGSTNSASFSSTSLKGRHETFGLNATWLHSSTNYQVPTYYNSLCLLTFSAFKG